MPDSPLANLKDIHLPEATGWWPPAPGWWLLALLLLLSPLLWRWLRSQLKRKPRRRYRSAALRELDQLYQHYQQQQIDNAVFIQSVSALLKRVAMQCYPPGQVAALSGAQWGEFLGRDQNAATRETIKTILSQTHSPHLQADVSVLYRFARQWIEARETF